MKDILKERIILSLKTVYDPEIPVNIYDIGLIYDIIIDEESNVKIIMTLTNPNCPVADSLPNEVLDVVRSVDGVKKAELELTFNPPWTMDKLTDEAKLELGLL
ncbi:MAG: FeS assembly system protein [Bacteroidetes bacterium]|nr:FeS assembly system protein [Bacteroidota bacterium]